MQWDHAFGVSLACRDAQARMAVRIRIQAIEAKSGDLAAAGATPAQQEQCRALILVVQVLDGDH